MGNEVNGPCSVAESDGTIPSEACPCAPAKLRLRQSVQRKYRYTQCAVFDGSCRNQVTAEMLVIASWLV
jgi:hypothetical protein